MEASAPQNKRQPLERDVIVRAAIALADANGVGALAMRKLAEELGFKVMALYNHVANKDDLLGYMVDAVAAEIQTPPSDTPPLEALRSVAISMQAVLRRHPWAPELWNRHLPGLARTRHMEYLLRTLDHTGLPGELAHHGFHAITNHVVGYTLQEVEMSAALGSDQAALEGKGAEYLSGISAEEFPYMVAHVHQHLEGHASSSFELVLNLILDGLVRMSADRSTGRYAR